MEHLTGQYFLSTDLRAEEIREQIGLLCEAGYEAIFLHARAGLKTPVFPTLRIIANYRHLSNKLQSH